MPVLWDVPLAEVEWADGTASHAVFALLTERSSHGCELRAQFEETIGPQWGGLNIGHLYQILERLVRDGYVTRSQVAQADRPDPVHADPSRQSRIADLGNHCLGARNCRSVV
ncbi:PadR family transcriptional regulator [Streptomyces sp. NPDC059215]|uniref:PadR family transcriptional regulator n=1 Tax=Streptomyces sp. NPDC059215 TaxID=3346772 RepID=UPI003676C91C